MFTIEEAKISKPTASNNIPAGAAREYGHDNIRRALQDEAEAAEAQQAEGFLTLAKSAWSRLTGVTIDQVDARTAAPAGDPDASR